MFSVVLYQPEIPPNTGNVMRLGAVTGCRLHLIGPLGFDLDDAKVRRAGLDYRDLAVVTIHPDLEAWREAAREARVVAFTVDGRINHSDFAFRTGDALLFGPESTGLPAGVLAEPWVTETLRLPMVAGVRSLNLSNAVAVAVYEAWRQNGFEGSVS